MKKNPTGVVMIFLSVVVAITAYFLPVYFGYFEGQKATTSWFFPNGYEAGPEFSTAVLLLAGIPILLCLITFILSMTGLRFITGIVGILTGLVIGAEFFLFRFVIEDINFSEKALYEVLKSGTLKQGPSLIVMLVGAVAMLFSSIFYIATTESD